MTCPYVIHSNVPLGMTFWCHFGVLQPPDELSGRLPCVTTWSVIVFDMVTVGGQPLHKRWRCAEFPVIVAVLAD